MAFFEVVCRCGHVGNGKYVLKPFAVIADSAKTAARIARDIPRVKHHNKHAIESVVEIDADRFNEICYQNSMDPYFRCRNKKEQKSACDLEILIDDRFTNVEDASDSISRKAIYSGKTKIKNPRKFYRYHQYSNERAA